MRRLSLAAAAMFAVSSLGCGTPGTVKFASNENFEPDDYRRILNRWTRSDEVYDYLNSILFVHATFHAPEFRRAFSVRHPDVYGPGSEQAGRLMLTRPGAENLHEFFLSVSTSDPRWNDLDEKDSIWRVTLERVGQTPVVGEVLRVRPNANLQVIYPFITPYARTYRVSFPLTDPEGIPLVEQGQQKIVLGITSALGQARLLWSVDAG